MERSEDELIRRSEPESLVSVTVGRFMSTLLSARPKKLRESISRLSPDSQNGSSGSVDEALCFLEKWVRDAAERNQALGETLVPIIEHDSKHGNPAMILLNWLFQDEVIFQAISRNLSKIISRNEDKFLALGWCLLVRGIVESVDNGDQSFWNGIWEKHSIFVEIVSSCVPHLVMIVRNGSVLQDGYEVPSRLSVSAADCLLSITGALAKRVDTLANRPKPSISTGSHRPVALIPNISEKKKKQTSRPEDSNSETNCLLWNHLEDLTRLVQCLFGWNRKTRVLHAKGLSQVLRWLEVLKEHHDISQKEAGTEVSMGGAILLSSCWKHYSVLLHMEDLKFSKISKDLLEQYLSGIKPPEFDSVSKDGLLRDEDLDEISSLFDKLEELCSSQESGNAAIATKHGAVESTCSIIKTAAGSNRIIVPCLKALASLIRDIQSTEAFRNASGPRIVMFMSTLYTAAEFNFIPTGGFKIVTVFDYAAIAMILILRLVGIYRRGRLAQRVRHLAAAVEELEPE